jgi:hypothetical protein
MGYEPPVAFTHLPSSRSYTVCSHSSRQEGTDRPNRRSQPTVLRTDEVARMSDAATDPAQPKCPDCGARGLHHIVSEPSRKESKGGDPWHEVVFCDQCGHVYGVYAKVVYSPRQRLPAI